MSQQSRWWMLSSTLILLLCSSVMLWGLDSKRYSGTWQSDGSGAGGKITIALGTSPADSSAGFTIGDADVKTTVKRVKIDGDSIEIAYDFDLQGNALTSTLTAKRNGSKLEGKYRTTVTGGGDQVDTGTFTAAE